LFKACYRRVSKKDLANKENPRKKKVTLSRPLPSNAGLFCFNNFITIVKKYVENKYFFSFQTIVYFVQVRSNFFTEALRF